MAQPNKSAVIKNFQTHGKDTGSVEVQIALITERIKNLTEHFKTHKHDFGSKRGLLVLVGQRRRFLNYVQRNNEAKYKELVERLGLRK